MSRHGSAPRTMLAALAGALIVDGTACEPLAGDADSLRATERERLRALVAADLPRARQLHADDFQLINPLGGARRGRWYGRTRPGFSSVRPSDLDWHVLLGPLQPGGA